MRVLTTDVYCAAFLITQGDRLIDLFVDRSGGKPAGTFVLEGNEVLEHQEAYSRGRAMASVKAIRDGVTLLRGELARALGQAAERRSHSATR